MRMYGIANCDTVKKARDWCLAHHVPIEFHDFKKHGLDAGLLTHWLHLASWTALLNRKGQTWRKLDATTRDAIQDKSSALRLMLERPSIVRRPIIEHGDRLIIGFSEDDYAQLLEEDHAE